MGATKHQIMLQNDQNIHLEFKNVNWLFQQNGVTVFWFSSAQQGLA